MTATVSTAPWLLRIYLAQAEACAAAGCTCCAREAARYRAALVACERKD